VYKPIFNGKNTILILPWQHQRFEHSIGGFEYKEQVSFDWTPV